MEYENYFLFVFSFRIANLEAFPWGLFFKHKLSYFWSVRSECMMMFHKTSNWIKYAFLDMSKYKSIYMKTDLRATPLIFTHPSMPYRWWITSLCSSYHQKIFCGIFFILPSDQMLLFWYYKIFRLMTSLTQLSLQVSYQNFIEIFIFYNGLPRHIIYLKNNNNKFQ